MFRSRSTQISGAWSRARIALLFASLAVLPAAAQAGPFGSLGDMIKRKASSVAEEAVDGTLRKRAPRPESQSSDAPQPVSTETSPKPTAARRVPAAPTKGWQMVGDHQARLVNELGESYTVTRVADGYTFELVIPSAKPEELNLWTPNFRIADSRTSHIDFDNSIPLGYKAVSCRGRGLPRAEADACVASRHRKVDDNTIFLWVPTAQVMPQLKTVFGVLASGSVIEVDYLFPSERKTARFSTAGGADVRKLQTL